MCCLQDIYLKPIENNIKIKEKFKYMPCKFKPKEASEAK